MSKSRRSGPSQRQLRVGELVRQALSELLQRGELRHPALSTTSITVSEVRMSTDLRHAVAFVMPLGGENADAVLQGLAECAPFIRGQIARRVALKFAPDLKFEFDHSFDEAERIERLLDRALPGGAAPDED
jgi:ribosome-binding factor A